MGLLLVAGFGRLLAAVGLICEQAICSCMDGADRFMFYGLLLVFLLLFAGAALALVLG